MELIFDDLWLLIQEKTDFYGRYFDDYAGNRLESHAVSVNIECFTYMNRDDLVIKRRPHGHQTQLEELIDYVTPGL